MSTAEAPAPAVPTDREVRVRLPEPQGTIAPVARRRMVRALAAYAVLWAAGLLPSLLGAGAALRAFGLGVVLPGGGFLLAGAPLLFVAAAVAFVASVATWWFAGPTVLPPLVWLLSAALGAVAAPGDDVGWAAVAVAATVPLAVVVAAAVHRVRHAGQVRTGRELNRWLQDVPITITGTPPLRTGREVVESSDEDLARLRYGLDLALQPLESFDGFTTIDQYREAATRYQINALGYGLSMAQFTRTPAFTGYLAEAQRQAIEKMLQRRVWSYWARENAWGNLRWNPDPVDTPENIMLTGFHGVMVGMYESLNDDRYSRPGALTFRWDDRRAYEHDFGTLADTVRRNVERSEFGLIACEPNWIYTICNTFALNTLVAHDRLHGSDHVARAGAKLKDAYETEFLRPDGRIIGVRAGHLGLSWNFWAGESVQLATAFWLHAGLPEVAQRTWWLLRERSLRLQDGHLAFPRTVGSKLDPGNYRLGRDTFSLAVTLMSAREVGDEETARAAQRTLDDRERVAEQDGAERWADASGLANLYGIIGRFGRRSGLRDLIAFDVPDAWREGPVLADTAYPDVLVARAVTDGQALDLVLVPGRGPVRTTLAVERLRPGGTYAVSGATSDTVVADHTGRGLIEVELDGRRAVRIH